MEIAVSAHKHGISAGDIVHALARPLASSANWPKPPVQVMHLGFDRLGRLMEIGTVRTTTETKSSCTP